MDARTSLTVIHPAITLRRAPTERTALAVLVAGAILLGLTSILLRLTETGPAAGGFWRMLFALPFLIWPAARDGRLLDARILKPGLLAGALFGLDLLTWGYGVFLTSIANATVLGNCSPVVVVIAGWLLFRETPTKAFLVALALAIGGAVVMALAKGSGGAGTNPPLGDVLALIGGVFYGGYIVVMRLTRREGASVWQLMLWTSVAGAIVLFAGALALHERLLPLDWKGWAACAALGLVHVTGQGALAWALGRLPANLTSVVILVQMVASAALAWAIFGEPVVALQALGAGVLVAGILLAQRSTRVAAPKPA